MRHTRGVASLLATLSFALVLGSCAERGGPLDPTASAPDPAASLVGTLELETIQVLERTKPLDEQVTSAVIGPDGGMLKLDGAGLEFHVPAGALDEPTEITITSPAGDLVGYHFEPHGLRFAKPARLNQNLKNTEADLLLTDLVGAYFEGALEAELEVDADDLLGVDLLGSDNVAVLEIHHFSGYVIATN